MVCIRIAAAAVDMMLFTKISLSWPPKGQKNPATHRAWNLINCTFPTADAGHPYPARRRFALPHRIRYPCPHSTLFSPICAARVELLLQFHAPSSRIVAVCRYHRAPAHHVTLDYTHAMDRGARRGIFIPLSFSL